MVDTSKRKSIMSLGGVMAIPFVPKMASANNNAIEALNLEQNAEHIIPGANGELSISLELDGEPMMRVTNNAGELAILRRIQPGHVAVDGVTYDLNLSLVGSAYAIGAGKSRLIPISEARLPLSPASDYALANRYRNKPMRMATLGTDATIKSKSYATRAFVA